MTGVVPPQVQDSALLVELQVILLSPPLQPTKALADGSATSDAASATPHSFVSSAECLDGLIYILLLLFCFIIC